MNIFSQATLQVQQKLDHVITKRLPKHTSWESCGPSAQAESNSLQGIQPSLKLLFPFFCFPTVRQRWCNPRRHVEGLRGSPESEVHVVHVFPSSSTVGQQSFKWYMGTDLALVSKST